MDPAEDAAIGTMLWLTFVIGVVVVLVFATVGPALFVRVFDVPDDLVNAARVAVAAIERNPDPFPHDQLAREPEGEEVLIHRPDGTVIRAVVAGEGPTVVLAHGYFVTVGEWNIVWDTLVARGHRVIAFDQPYTHKGSQKNLLGEGASAELTASLSNEKQVTDQTPPCFLWHTWEDKGVPPENSVVFYQALLAKSTLPNLWDLHPPFQIDGNFGGAAGIAEMLVQCDEDEIRLLPALPSAWPSGRVTGLRARGGFEVDLSWKDGAVERATVRSLRGGPLRLRRGETLRTLGDTARGAVLVFEGDDLRRVLGRVGGSGGAHRAQALAARRAFSASWWLSDRSAPRAASSSKTAADWRYQRQASSACPFSDSKSPSSRFVNPSSDATYEPP